MADLVRQTRLGSIMYDPAWLIRPVESQDVDEIIALAQALGPGMTTLPADRDTIARKIDSSVATFGDRNAEDPQYLLVLEQRASGRLLGISGVYPRVGDSHGFFSYKLTKLIQRSVSLQRRYEIELLTLSNDYTGATEIGTLAILPELRGTAAGPMLARARYMLIGAFPERFATRVMAEMRGWQDDRGHSPFWDAVGARFFGMSFVEADRLSATEGAGFIADLMPKQPIYTALLPPAARHAIGRAHDVSARAMALLMKEDFRYEAHVDVFDGGPQVHAMRDHIATIRNSRMVGIGGPPPRCEGGMIGLLSNTALPRFRVVEGHVYLADGGALVDKGILAALELARDDRIRVAPGRRLRP